MALHDLDVFINCPFDEEFKPLFQALHFTISACSYLPRCALEDVDGSDVRFAKLCRIIRECPKSVHDLSRTQSKNGLPRFNMPFELGLMMGAKQFGRGVLRSKSALLMVAKKYKMPAYLSDLGGNDPFHHDEKPAKIVEAVRNYLDIGPGGAPLPGPKHISAALDDFESSLPGMAAQLKIALDECDAFANYRTYAHFVAAYLRNNPVL